MKLKIELKSKDKHIFHPSRKNTAQTPPLHDSAPHIPCVFLAPNGVREPEPKHNIDIARRGECVMISMGFRNLPMAVCPL